jgi:hypothetical protein
MTSGYKAFTAGEVLTASDVNNYLMQQSVMTFGGSAARSSAIGTANFEEGMVSYLKDTDKVEAYNGTNWVSVAPTSTQGLTLISTTTFSAVSSVSLPADTFTATYQNYKVIVIVTQTNTTDLFFRLRTAGTDNSNASYGYQLVINDNTTLTGSRTGSNTGFAGYNQAASTNIFDITILRPQETQKTNIISNATLLADGTSIRSAFANGLFNATTSFDSFSTIVSAGTISGTMYAYGLAK